MYISIQSLVSTLPNEKRWNEARNALDYNIMVDAHVHEQSMIQISLKSRPRCYACETKWLEMLHMNTLRHSHVHIRLPGSGLHIPLDVQVAVILVDGTNIGVHVKNISASSVVS